MDILQPVTRAWQNEFLFFTTGKQTRSIIARVESLTFRLAPLIITLRREVIQLSLNVDPTWSTPRVNRYARVNFTNIINGYPYRHRVPITRPTPPPSSSLSSIPRKSCACINEVTAHPLLFLSVSSVSLFASFEGSWLREQRLIPLYPDNYIDSWMGEEVVIGRIFSTWWKKE